MTTSNYKPSAKLQAAMDSADAANSIFEQYATVSRELAELRHNLDERCDRLTALADDTLAKYPLL